LLRRRRLVCRRARRQADAAAVTTPTKGRPKNHVSTAMLLPPRYGAVNPRRSALYVTHAGYICSSGISCAPKSSSTQISTTTTPRRSPTRSTRGQNVFPFAHPSSSHCLLTSWNYSRQPLSHTADVRMAAE
jgi:hypothetical protein